MGPCINRQLLSPCHVRCRSRVRALLLRLCFVLLHLATQPPHTFDQPRITISLSPTLSEAVGTIGHKIMHVIAVRWATLEHLLSWGNHLVPKPSPSYPAADLPLTHPLPRFQILPVLSLNLYALVRRKKPVAMLTVHHNQAALRPAVDLRYSFELLKGVTAHPDLHLLVCG